MEYIQSFFIFLITFYIILKISKCFKVTSLDASKIFIFRSIICLIYLSFLNISGVRNDAIGYYQNNIVSEKFIDTGLIQNITFFLKHNLYLNQASCALVFTFIGSI